MAQPLFPLSVPDGYSSDLYPRLGLSDKAVPADGHYKVCDSKKLPPLSPKAKRLCRLWRMQTPMALSEFFKFSDDATFEQYTLFRPRGGPGSAGAIDVTSYKRGHLLVTPNNYVSGMFVNVLPGAYRIDYRIKNVPRAEQYLVGYQSLYQSMSQAMPLVPTDLNTLVESSMGPVLDGSTFAAKFRTSSLDEVDDSINSSSGDVEDDATAPKGKSCRDVGVVYKTELRSYCVYDPAKAPVEGCDQNQTSFCELIPIIK
jgi:hypothetical protein